MRCSELEIKWNWKLKTLLAVMVRSIVVGAAIVLLFTAQAVGLVVQHLCLN